VKYRPKQKVYFIQNEETGAIKIGQAQRPSQRLAELQVGNSSKLRLLGTILDYELSLHCKFSACRLIGEWFKPTINLLDFLHELGFYPLTETTSATEQLATKRLRIHKKALKFIRETRRT
jgi:hypothetical protein